MSLRLHGDRLARPGSIDFAVNVWPAERPARLQAALADALNGGGYPDERVARAAVAARHDRDPAEILLLNGACEGFWLLALALRPARVACIHPGFTEPEAAFRAVGSEIVRVHREQSTWRLDPDSVPDAVEIVAVGNPDNPTGVLEESETLARLRRPGRLVVVDESFMDFVPGETATLDRAAGDGLVVVRSLTKLWSLAGVRAGYLIGSAALVEQLEQNRQPWSVNALACAALAVCSADRDTPAQVATEVAAERARLIEGLAGLPFVEHVWPSAANFVLVEVRGGRELAAQLSERRLTVRPAESFPGLGPDHIRIAVRQRGDNERLVAALTEIGERWG